MPNKNKYYRISINTAECEELLKRLNLQYKKLDGNFIPYFSENRSEILLQIKTDMDSRLDTDISLVATLSTEDIPGEISDVSFEKLQPKEIEIKEVLEGTKLLKDILDIKPIANDEIKSIR
jgi:hypothetical protein